MQHVAHFQYIACNVSDLITYFYQVAEFSSITFADLAFNPLNQKSTGTAYVVRFSVFSNHAVPIFALESKGVEKMVILIFALRTAELEATTNDIDSNILESLYRREKYVS